MTNCLRAIPLIALLSVYARAGEMVDPLLSVSSVSAGALDAVPDIREEKLNIGSGNFVAVPIPISNPTFGTGLVAVGAYYRGQSEAQKKVQPPSFTGAGGVYTDNKSYAFGVMHQFLVHLAGCPLPRHYSGV